MQRYILATLKGPNPMGSRFKSLDTSQFTSFVSARECVIVASNSPQQNNTSNGIHCRILLNLNAPFVAWRSSVRLATSAVRRPFLRQIFPPQPPATPAMIDDTTAAFSFPAVAGKKVTAAFDGGRITSDGGVMLLSLAVRRLGIARSGEG